MASNPALAYNLIPRDAALGIVAEWDIQSPEERSASIDESGSLITEAQVTKFAEMVKHHVILGVFPYVTAYIIPHDGSAPCYQMDDLLVVGSKL